MRQIDSSNGKKIKVIDFFGLVVLLLYGFFSLQKCLPTKPKNPLNVILITLDTQRADFISAYDSTRASTPTLDSLAGHGILWENCYSPIPITVPAHGSLFYSLPPHELILYNNGQTFTNERNLVSLAQLFKKKGYQTAGFVSLGVLKAEFGLADGFDHFEDQHPENRWYLHAEEVNSRVFPWVEKNKSKRFFLWIHYSDPHDPYAAPSVAPDLRIHFNGQAYADICVQREERLSMRFPIRKGENAIECRVLNPYPEPLDEFRISLNDVRFSASKDLKIRYDEMNVVQKEEQTNLLIKDRGWIKIHNPGDMEEVRMEALGRIYLLAQEKVRAYKEEVEYLDLQLGRLLKKLDQQELLDKSFIVVVGDHGEGLGNHRTPLGDPHFGHIHYLYTEYLKVPLIFYHPNWTDKGIRKTEPATILDVAPTILAIMDWEKIPHHKGIDLLNLGNERNQIIYGETYRPESTRDRFSGLQYPLHLIFTPGRDLFELYNVRDDPTEQSDLFSANQSNPDVSVLQKTLKKHAVEIMSQKKDIEHDPKNLEMLKSLGYIKQ